MIANYEVKANPILEAIKLSERHVFYLTGSRFFGSNNEQSDWDFFIQDSPAIHKWLTDWKFKPLPKYYGNERNDSNMALVYRHYKYQVDVQVQKDVNLKHSAQKVILSMKKWRSKFNFATRQEEWEFAYDIVLGLK